MIDILYYGANVIANTAGRLCEGVKRSHFTSKSLRLLRPNTQSQHARLAMTSFFFLLSHLPALFFGFLHQNDKYPELCEIQNTKPTK